MLSHNVLGPALAVLCVSLVLGAALVYWLAALGSPWTVPHAALRAIGQLALVSLVLAAAMSRLWSSVLVLAVMFAATSLTAVRRSHARRSSLLAVSLAVGLVSLVPALLGSGVVPLTGVSIVPVVGIVLGGTMTATAVAARRALDALHLRAGEVDAALSLGLTDRDARLEVIRGTASDALLPNLDQTRTVGLVTLPGAFVGVLVSTGSAVQAGAVQVLVLLAILLSQTSAVAVTVELIARGLIYRAVVSQAHIVL